MNNLMVNQFTSKFGFKERKYFPRKCFNAFSLSDTIEEKNYFLQFKNVTFLCI